MKLHYFATATRKTFGLCLLTLGLLGFSTAAAMGDSLPTSEAEQEDLVKRLVVAFNNRNVPEMLELLDENVEWLTIGGAKISIEASGKKALGTRMTGYFRTCTSCKSSLDWIQTTGTRVLALERATWKGKTGVQSHTTLSVYEFRNNKILRVYYFQDADDGSH